MHISSSMLVSHSSSSPAEHNAASYFVNGDFGNLLPHHDWIKVETIWFSSGFLAHRRTLKLIPVFWRTVVRWCDETVDLLYLFQPMKSHHYISTSFLCWNWFKIFILLSYDGVPESRKKLKWSCLLCA